MNALPIASVPFIDGVTRPVFLDADGRDNPDCHRGRLTGIRRAQFYRPMLGSKMEIRWLAEFLQEGMICGHLRSHCLVSLC